ncbi:MAG TPA: efflux RND transporter periplasmic adaptor subunit [Polyangia bacterium]|nr:efflux RND transporter periplasmic adaptor subunit [Polyangia bacterium]
MKRALVAALVVLVAGAAVYFFLHGRKPPAVRYETAKVTRGNITARVTATGTLSALVTVQVGSQVSGRISQINVDFNSPVKKGQIVAKIDPQLFAAAVENGKANVAAAEGQLAQAKANAKNLDLQRQRSRKLREQNLVAQADLDTAEAAADAAAANVEVQTGQLAQARAQLHQAQVNLDYTTIISPTDGTVISRNVDVGQTVAASFSAPVLFTVAQDLTKMQVDTSVAEADVGKLKPQMPATFTVDAYPTERFRGTVRQIRNAPTTVQNVVTYDAVIDVDNGDLKLKPGMTANVTFVYAEKKDVVRVPNAAMRFKPPAELLAPTMPSGGAAAATRPAAASAGGAPAASSGASGKRPHGAAQSDQRQLWVLRGERPTQVNVKVGVSDGTLSEIVDGDVKEGEDVVTDVASGPKGAPSSTQGGPRFRGF